MIQIGDYANDELGDVTATTPRTVDGFTETAIFRLVEGYATIETLWMCDICDQTRENGHAPGLPEAALREGLGEMGTETTTNGRKRESVGTIVQHLKAHAEAVMKMPAGGAIHRRS